MRTCRNITVLMTACLLVSIGTAQERTVTQLTPAASVPHPVPQINIPQQQQPTASHVPAQETELVKRLRQLAKLREQPNAAQPGRVSQTPADQTLRQVSHQTHSTATPHPPTVTTEPAFLDLTQPIHTADAAEISTSEPSNRDMFVQFGVWTVIILCCCGLTVLSIRHWQRRNGILPVANSVSRVLETVSLGPRRSISLVQLGDVRAVVGCDATGVTSIVLAPESFEISLAETDLEHTHIQA
jgi:flagellar biogenesis protein FliO